MKTFLGVVLIAYLVVATIGLAGGGPEWLRYVGAATVMVMLLLILQGVSNIPTATEQKKMFGEAGRPSDWRDPGLDATEAQDPAPRRSVRN